MSLDYYPEALLFDSDGVLVDSDASVISAWTHWAQHYDLDPENVLALVHGRRSRDSVALLLPASAQAEALARIDQLEVEDGASVTALPGAADLLASLDDVPWAIVTSAVAPLAVARLAAAGLPRPRALVTADLLERGKPAPDGYLEGARLLGVDPHRCIVFEDADNGVRAARAAGVSAVIGISERSLESDADVVLRSLAGVRWHDGTLTLDADDILRADRSR